MIDLKPFHAQPDPDPMNCRTSRVGAVMPGDDQQMYYCVVDEIESSEIHYCEIDEYECRYVLPSAFDSIGKEPEEKETPTYSADVPLPPGVHQRRQGNERPRRLSLDLPER
jgi:hypothetical protein